MLGGIGACTDRRPGAEQALATPMGNRIYFCIEERAACGRGKREKDEHVVLEEYMKGTTAKDAVEAYSAVVVARFIESLYDTNLGGADLVEYRNLVDRLKKETTISEVDELKIDGIINRHKHVVDEANGGKVRAGGGRRRKGVEKKEGGEGRGWRRKGVRSDLGGG